MRASSALTALALTAGLGATALAQDDDVIIVTGSVIQGTPEDAALPVDVLSSEELARLGNPSPVELIKALPVSSGVIGDTNQFDSRSQATEGMASVNLRGLSPQRTLVLLNNRRLVAAGTGTPFVDVNLLPHAAIGRIEILKDGAAAIYGSDAVGGVVNFITRTGQEGLRFGGDYTFISDSDGDYTLQASYGQSGDNWDFLLAAGYQHRSELQARDRDFAVRDFEYNPEGGWTGGGNPATFLPLGFIPGVGVAPIGGLVPDPDCAVLGGYVTAQNRCRTQYTGFDNLVEEEDRYQLYAQFNVDLTDNVSWDLSVLYGNDEIPEYRTSPMYLLTQPPSASVGGSPSGFIVPANNPGFIQMVTENPGYVPASTLAVLFPTLLFRPLLAGGNPSFADNGLGSATGFRENDSFRVSTGISADISDTTNLSVAMTYHKFERYFTGYDSFGDRVQLGLLGYGGPNCTPFAGAPGVGDCMWYNPFGNQAPVNPVTGVARPGDEPNQNSAALIDWFFVQSSTLLETELFVFDATLSGETGWEMSGGPVMYGIGAQYRQNSFEATYGDNNNIAVNPCRDTPVYGNTTCNPANGALAFLGSNADATADNDVYALFAELQLPVTDDLNVQLAARYEDYGGGTGSTFDPKVTARWQINDTFALRGSVGTTFRGPPAQQLAARNVTSLQVIASSFRPVDVYGNPNLAPETATNYSVGFLVDNGPFTASVDYFRYEIEDTITVEPLSGMVSTLFADPANCTDPTFDGLRERFLFNDGAGVPGAGTCAASNISRVRTGWVNGGSLTSSGIDVILNYDFGDVAGGQLNGGITATYMIGNELGPEVVEGIQVQDGFDGVGYLNFQTTAYPVPQWKTRAFLEYTIGAFDARMTVNYIDSYRDQRADLGTGPFAPNPYIVGNPVLTQGATIDSQTTLDFNLIYNFGDATTFSVTALNVTDEDPALARLDYNYDPFTGNPLGRMIRVGFSSEF
nr:TonB-dependent receptor [Maricaulis parjimensis]